MSQPAISKHLKVLERAGLISRELEEKTTMKNTGSLQITTPTGREVALTVST